MYDFLVVGAGLFGSVFAHEMTKLGYTVWVIDKRSHIAGNCYTSKHKDINVHEYGPHIFHTASDNIWNYVNQFASFNNFKFTPKAYYKGQQYSLPINLNTFREIAGCQTPEEAVAYLANVKEGLGGDDIESWCLANMGRTIYETLIKGYTEKQWGRAAKDLPASIIKRMVIRTIADNNYFNHKHQGIPIGGYTSLIENMLHESRVNCNVDFFELDWQRYAKRVVYTGPIDRLFNYCYGELEYRSLRFEKKIVENTFQEVAQVNYTDAEVPYTRIVEHKHFEFGGDGESVITYEYPEKWTVGQEPAYPIRCDKNIAVYNKYTQLIPHDIIVGGRLGSYLYYDMDQVIASALKLVEKMRV